MHRAIALISALILTLATGSSVFAAPGSSDDHAKRYYVSVGDSLAASVQPIGDAADLYRTNEGYAEQLLELASSRWAKLSLVKLGCPGETTQTMLAGGLCEYPHGSQLDEAVAFLRAHRQFVAFVTIDIGANDFTCQQPECIPAGVARIQQNLPRILAALREAAGPDVPIVGMTLYNPFLATWLLGVEGQAFAQLSAELYVLINGVFRATFETGGALVAEVDGAFSSDDFTTIVELPGAGEVPLNVARICQWTWVCAPPPLGPDNHANSAGYAVIAATFASVLGL